MVTFPQVGLSYASSDREVWRFAQAQHMLLLTANRRMQGVVSCPHCGTSYLTAQTLHEIDRIKRHRHELASQRPVAVAAFA
jgi:hypothetical protein